MAGTSGEEDLTELTWRTFPLSDAEPTEEDIEKELKRGRTADILAATKWRNHPSLTIYPPTPKHPLDLKAASLNQAVIM